MRSEIKFQMDERSDLQEYTLRLNDCIRGFTKRERRYIDNRIDINAFNQPKKRWLRDLLYKFRSRFNPQVARFLNEKNGRVIGTMDLQEEFNATFKILKEEE